MNDFEEYIRQSEPNRQQRAYAWRTAIGLQAVDGLKPSDYLKDTARKHIEGDIDIDEAQRLIKSYYQSKTIRTPDDDDLEEADIVSSHIAKILGEQSFAFSIVGITSIHRRLFEGVFKFAGKIRDYDITKKEWVLGGDTVLYVNSEDIRMALEYELEQESTFVYAGLSNDRMVEHIAKFVSGIWQIHPFGEGNTRTTAVFTIKYLRSIGFYVDNDLFANNSWYFRNALVRANYRNVVQGIEPDLKYLVRFFRNLLMGETNELRNRYMIINSPFNDTPASTPTSTPASTPASSRSQFYTDNEHIQKLVKIIADEKRSIKEILELLELRDRKNFIEYYLNPALSDGFVALLYPDKPRHPRQKYILTVKGLALLSSLPSVGI
ncbi:Fic family protein [Petrimonas mucosa]|uniref:Fic family protein n=1 Tax=Petrimonas mucosa TaxID=1642646 RepID=UPI001778D5C3|nr:Fic family protein [Petrimonas mucosa]HHT28991.1 cell filamentation protein Fic [Petrimonas mucosa]